MANTPSRPRLEPLPPEVIADDIDTYLTYKAVAPYMPPSFSAMLEKVGEAYEKMLAAEEACRVAEEAARLSRLRLIDPDATE